MSRRVTASLEALNQAATGMAAGNYDARVTTSSDIQELQTLSGTFNTMADEVKAARQVQRDFLANVSHDLRTPLTSIQGFSQAMMDGAVPAPQLNRVATIIYTEAGRLSRLVLDLLDLARIEAGRFSMNRRDINLKDILGQVKESFEPQAERANVTLDFKVPSRALPLFADADRLSQVFGNLLDNAITYARQGERHVKVTAVLGGLRNLRSYSNSAVAAVSANGNGLTPSVEEVLSSITAPRPAISAEGVAVATIATATATKTATVAAPPTNGNGTNGNGASKPLATDGAVPTTAPTAPVAEGEGKLGRWWVEVTITDDGPGIGYDQKARVFERFHRGDAARSGGGLGLGLAISKEIVEAHGGDISVQDNTPTGTAFIIRLPMKMW
jgi:signal transduction histidine kinase